MSRQGGCAMGGSNVNVNPFFFLFFFLYFPFAHPFPPATPHDRVHGAVSAALLRPRPATPRGAATTSRAPSTRSRVRVVPPHTPVPGRRWGAARGRPSDRAAAGLAGGCTVSGSVGGGGGGCGGGGDEDKDKEDTDCCRLCGQNVPYRREGKGAHSSPRRTALYTYGT